MTEHREAEWVLVAGLLFDGPTALAECRAQGVTPQDHAEDDLRVMHAAVALLCERGQDVNVMSVWEAVGELGARRPDDMAVLVEMSTRMVSGGQVATAARIVREHAEQRRAVSELSAGAARLKAAKAAEASGIFAELLARLSKELPAATKPQPAPFRAVAVAIGSADLAPAYGSVWGVYVPDGVVTVLSGHGGVGKSLLAMMFMVCVATGRPLFDLPTRRSRVAFFSGEDGADLLQQRLLWVCERMGVDPDELEGWAHLLDATEGEPVLYHEVHVGGQRTGATTATYAELRRFVDAHQIEVLIVDNMSDTFDANEIERAKVSAFMRSLPQLRTDRRLTVLLLAHVDKATARGDRGSSDAYSGSTAVHNKARSRIYLAREKDGQLKLEHQKFNLTRQQAPLLLCWPDGQLMQVDQPMSGMGQALVNTATTRALLRLIGEFTDRAEYVSTSINSQSSASRLLAGEPGYPPGRKPAEVQALLRSAERDGLLRREQYATADRKRRERWELTDAGRRLTTSVAPGAPGSR